jgi:hypothetical protein
MDKIKLKQFLVYTEIDLLKSHVLTPPQPIASIKAFSQTGAQAALYVACKEGIIEEEIDIDNVKFLDISEFLDLTSHEINYATHTSQISPRGQG